MGEIFEGRDLELGRDLAVKVIREEHRDDPEIVRRFIEEARIGGQLQHPGITPIHDLGRFADGRLFIAMKLVRGRTLAELLEAREGIHEDRTQFLSIFVQVCQAIAYAHSRGVIHRDLKPSNIMVGAFAEVQVMDWGLAKALGHDALTSGEAAISTPGDPHFVETLRCGTDRAESRIGSVIGTPAYMAPEQARGELDTLDERADVFALGSILCEILTGQAAFAGSSTTEVCHKAERAELAEALARLAVCAADAELVELARSCLAAAPKHRPRDAGAVADHLTSYLGGVERRLREAELAQARAEAQAAGERRRRLLTLALAASVLATAMIGAAGWAWITHEQQRRARVVQARVEAALAEASRNRDKARGADEAASVAWVEAVEAARRAESLLGTGDAGRELHDRVKAFMDDLVRERDTAERAERDRRMVERLAAIQNDFGVHNDDAKADAEYAAAFRAYGVDVDRVEPGAAGRALAASPAVADLANALDHWAFMRRGRTLHDPAGAARLVAAALAADPDPWRTQLRETLIRTGRNSAQRLEILERLAATADVGNLPGASVTRLAGALAVLGRRELAIALLRRAQPVHRDDFWVNADLGRELLVAGRPEEAVRYFDVAAGVRPRSGLALRGLARALLRSGQPAEASDRFREVTRLRPDDALSHVALGSALLRLGKPDEADAEFREARRLKPDDWAVRDQIAVALSEWGELAAAVDEQKESVRRFPKLAVVHKALAHALQTAGLLDDAIAEFREAVRLQPRYSAAHLYLGRALIDAGDYRSALEVLARVDPGPPFADPMLSSSTLASRAEYLQSLEVRLAGVLQGQDRPAGSEECADFARIAFSRRLYEGSARLWTDLFAAAPPFAADPTMGNHFPAARAAALAGCEDCKPVGSSSARSRAQWRAQAMIWLEADLAASAVELESGSFAQREAALKRLGRWHVDPALAVLRDEQSLAKLSDSERRSLRDFWSRADRVRARANAPAGDRPTVSRNP
jgi:serine/threonine-protein kinase